MSVYEPTAIPLAFAPGARGWLALQLRRIADALSTPVVLSVRFVETHVTPARVNDGDMYLADGVDWNPGAGAGLYIRLAGAWVKIS